MSVLFASAVLTCQAYDIELPNGQCFNKIDNNTLEFAKYIGTENIDAIIVPEKVLYNTYAYTVTAIGPYAFYMQFQWHSITLPNTITLIGHHAFGNTPNLQNLNIPETVTEIGAGAFVNTGLTAVKIPAGVTKLNPNVFLDCDNLESVKLNSSLITIGLGAFGVCEKLQSIVIPDNVTLIDQIAFNNCSQLSSVKLGKSVEAIYYNAFSHCNSLTTIDIPASLYDLEGGGFSSCQNLSKFTGANTSPDQRCIVIDGKLRAFAPGGLTEYEFPSSVTSIGKYSMIYCSNLTSITIPNSVTTIEPRAFEGCENLSTIHIPSSITSIGDGAFALCSGLKSFTGEFALSDGRCLIQGGRLIAIAPNGLSSYSLPESVKAIGNMVFEYNTNLKSVKINSGVTEIGERAFNQSKITELELPASVTSIGRMAVYGCSSMTSLTCAVPDPRAITLGDEAFRHCSNATLYVPIGSSPLYRSAEQWCDFTNIVEKDLGGVEQTHIDTTDDLSVIVDGDNIVVNGTMGDETVSVYSLAGELMYSNKASAGVTTVKATLTSGNIYVVKVGDHSVKIHY